MNDLSAQARAILDAGRTALAPSEAVRLRVRAAVDARMVGPAGSAASAAGGGAVKLVLLSCVVIAVVGAVVVAWRTSGPDSERVVEKSVVTARPASPVEAVEPRPVVTELVPDQPPPSPRQHPPRAPADPAPGLAEELAIIDQAQAALRAGSPDEAIAALDRHRRTIRTPQLEREALLLRAEALCAAGDRGDGLRVLEDVVARWPAAVGVEAVRSRCR